MLAMSRVLAFVFSFVKSDIVRSELDLQYSSTCHERTPSGPGKSVRTLQVAARHRDGQAGGGRQL